MGGGGGGEQGDRADVFLEWTKREHGAGIYASSSLTACTQHQVGGEDRVAANIFVCLVNLHARKAGLLQAVHSPSRVWDAIGLLTLCFCFSLAH